MSLRIFFALLLATFTGASLRSDEPKFPTPDDLDKLPVGIKVIHDPEEPYATPAGKGDKAKYTWKYKTTVTAIDGDITIVEFGGFSYHDGKWIIGKPFSAKEFAQWYKCPKALLKKGESYTDPMNWSNDNQLRAGKTLWYFIGVDEKGNRVKGEAVIELKDEVEPKKKPEDSKKRD